MTLCRLRDTWLSGALNRHDADDFSHHLDTCEPCRLYADSAADVQTQFARWICATENADAPTSEDARQFAEAVFCRARTRKTAVPLRPGFSRPVVYATAALLFLTIAALLWFRFRPSDQVEHSIPTVGDQASETVTPEPDTRLIQNDAEKEQIVELRRSRLTLSPHTRLTVSQASDAETEIHLESGTVLCDVAPLSPGASFRVLANDVMVTVVGTVFSVSFDADARVRVSVLKGRVQVQHGDDSHILKAEEERQFSDNPKMDTADESDPPAWGRRYSGATERKNRPAAAFDEWRAMISKGGHEEAAKQIRLYLDAVPHDDRARMLLAGVDRRQRRFNEALVSYERVMANEASQLAHQASYLAAEIARTGLRDHQRAIAYYDAYLKQSPPDASNRAEAELHLSESLAATGRTAQARDRLERIVRQYGRTPVADRARALLEKISDK